MRVVDCLDPQFITNPYSHERLRVRCGKCRACRNSLAKRWIDKLEQEKRCWKYCYFVTLTYDNCNLPRLFFDNDSFELFDKDDSSIRIPFEDLQFKSDKEFNYFKSRINHSLGIPYASVSDIQLFHKRLNKYIHDKFTKKYQNFRYFVCSEYGKDTFRPHYHGLYFFNDRQISDNFQEILSKTWTSDGSIKGRFDAEIVLGSATSYVAQYINMFSDLPTFYQNRKLKPFYIFSKQPPLGTLYNMDSEVSKLFFSSATTRTIYDAKRNEFIDVPLSYSLKNRLYPRLPKYSEIDVSLRTRLYGLARESNSGTFEEFKGFLRSFKDRCVSPDDFLVSSDYGKTFNYYLSWLTNGFRLDVCDYLDYNDYKTVDNRLKRFYCISKRVCAQSSVFGISLFNYVTYIDKYYKNLENSKLKMFYETQEKYSLSHDLEDLSFMYSSPNDFLFENALDYVPDIKDTFSYRDLFQTSEKIYNDSTKTHSKNDYLEKCRDKKLSLILKDYFYV